MHAVKKYVTPNGVARELGVGQMKVLRWIAKGELRAANLASRQGGRPRWRIAIADLEAFLRVRSNAAAKALGTKPRRRKADDEVTPFF